MPIFVNYAIDCRNPKRLLETCHKMTPRHKSEEVHFLGLLRMLPDSFFKPLLLVMGGFRDGMHGYARAIINKFTPNQHNACDVFYREHDEVMSTRELIRLYSQKRKTIVLVGHSWGGSSLVLDVIPATHAEISLLVTLDPVAWTNPPSDLSRVHRWVNIFVDYDKASYFNASNMAARVGRAWKEVRAADANFICSKDHDDASGMFYDYAFKEVMQKITIIN